tara:strand:- start:447 stop:2198 length:1752 start_codon:yes stop_codon:yes gene_type:complete
MKITDEIIVYKIIQYLNIKRKIQLIGILLLLIVSGLLEAFSIASAIPFLSLLSAPDVFYEISIFRNFSNFFNISNSSQLFLIATIVFCTLILLSTLIRLLNLWFIITISSKVNIDLSDIIFKKNLYQSYAEFTAKSSSKIISLLRDRIPNSTSAINAILKLISSIILALSIIIALVLINYKITFLILLCLLLYYFLISRKVKNILTRNSKNIANLEIDNIRIIQESSGGFRDIIINNNQKLYQHIFKEIQVPLNLKKANSEFLIAFPRFIMEAFTIIVIASFGFYLSRTSNDLRFITVLGTYAYAGQKLLPIIQQIYSGWAIYKYKSSNLMPVLNELSRNSYKYQFNNLRKREIKKFNSLELKNVSFSYEQNKNSKNILENVNLNISKGDFVGIYGKTGSGKSTLLDIIMGLLKPNIGEIILNNYDLYKKNKLYDWRNNLSHVPQNIFLKEGTIEENIIFDRRTNNFDYELLIKAAKIAHIYEFINELKEGFNTYVGERGIRLSGGQKQRIAIARAIFRKKGILVLDEATSALDKKTEASIIQSIKTLDKYMTIIMVTHRESTLSNCNKVFKVERGRVIYEGS